MFIEDYLKEVSEIAGKIDVQHAEYLNASRLIQAQDYLQALERLQVSRWCNRPNDHLDRVLDSS